MKKKFLLCLIFTLILPTSVSAIVTQEVITGAWKEKSGSTTYVFDNDFNFEYRRTPNPGVRGDYGTIEKGIWTLAENNCSIGTKKGNLYIQAGTDRCCHNAYFLGANLVLTAISIPNFTGVCSDRVLINDTAKPR